MDNNVWIMLFITLYSLYIEYVIKKKEECRFGWVDRAKI